MRWSVYCSVLMCFAVLCHRGVVLCNGWTVLCCARAVPCPAVLCGYCTVMRCVVFIRALAAVAPLPPGLPTPRSPWDN